MRKKLQFEYWEEEKKDEKEIVDEITREVDIINTSNLKNDSFGLLIDWLVKSCPNLETIKIDHSYSSIFD